MNSVTGSRVLGLDEAAAYRPHQVVDPSRELAAARDRVASPPPPSGRPVAEGDQLEVKGKAGSDLFAPGRGRVHLSLARLLPICAAFLAACSSLTTMPIVDRPKASQALDNWDAIRTRVDAIANPIIQQGVVPGLVVGISLPSGKSQFFAYGKTESEGGQPLTEDSLFQVGSLSKGFLATLLTMLVDEGVFSWKETLRDVLPPEIEIAPAAQGITMLELATHTSGLPRQAFDIPQLVRFAKFLFTGENIYGHLDERAIFSYLKSPSIQNRGKVQYSNIGYALVSLVIEHRTGKKIDDLIANRIWHPLGLGETAFGPCQPPADKPRVHGHAGDQPKLVRRGTPIEDWQFHHAMLSSTGVCSSPADILTYAHAHFSDMADHEVELALRHTLQPYACERTACAAVAWTIDHLATGDIAYQVGLMGGYTSYAGLNIKKRTAVVVLMNGFSWENRLGHSLLAELSEISTD